MSSRVRKLIWAGGTAALLFGAILWLRRPEAVEIDVRAVERGRVERTATNSRAGTVEARRRAKLSPESGGRVTAIRFRKGEAVRAGDVLLELDATLERGELELRRREVEAARAEAERACLAAELAERALERQRRLAAEELVAADALDRFDSAAREAAAACAAARAARGSAEAARTLAERMLEKRTLRAPFDGVVAELTIEVGEWTTPSPPGMPIPPVIDLIDPESIYFSLPMDEVDAGRLRGPAGAAHRRLPPGVIFPGASRASRRMCSTSRRRTARSRSRSSSTGPAGGPSCPAPRPTSR
jgi:HlyD family secretion protein